MSRYEFSLWRTNFRLYCDLIIARGSRTTSATELRILISDLKRERKGLSPLVPNYRERLRLITKYLPYFADELAKRNDRRGRKRMNPQLRLYLLLVARRIMIADSEISKNVCRALFDYFYVPQKVEDLPPLNSPTYRPTLIQDLADLVDVGEFSTKEGTYIDDCLGYLPFHGIPFDCTHDVNWLRNLVDTCWRGTFEDLGIDLNSLGKIGNFRKEVDRRLCSVDLNRMPVIDQLDFVHQEIRAQFSSKSILDQPRIP